MTMGPYYYPNPLSQKRESSPSAVFKDLVLSKTPKERKRKIERKIGREKKKERERKRRKEQEREIKRE